MAIFGHGHPAVVMKTFLELCNSKNLSIVNFLLYIYLRKGENLLYLAIQQHQQCEKLMLRAPTICFCTNSIFMIPDSICIMILICCDSSSIVISSIDYYNFLFLLKEKQRLNSTLLETIYHRSCFPKQCTLCVSQLVFDIYTGYVL